MAIIQMEMYSKCLLRTVSVTCILPIEAEGKAFSGTRLLRPFKTIYVLNENFDGNVEQLQDYGMIQEALAHELAVIMPSGENYFFVDNEISGEKYGKFIGEELIDMTRKAFHLSEKREDTYIAGFSMGGYGAFCNGLKYADTFSCIAGIASGFILEELISIDTGDSDHLFTRDFLQRLFGDLDRVICSDKDYKSLYIRQKENGLPAPRMYLACGEEDELLDCNRDYRDFLMENGGDVTYEEGTGKHDFIFWSKYMKRVFDWLPLEKNGN